MRIGRIAQGQRAIAADTAYWLTLYFGVTPGGGCGFRRSMIWRYCYLRTAACYGEKSAHMGHRGSVGFWAG